MASLRDSWACTAALTSNMSRTSYEKGVSTYLHNERYLVHKYAVPERPNAVMLLYTGIQTVLFGRRDTNNTHLSSQLRIRI
jgi:hypothetical protein